MPFAFFAVFDIGVEVSDLLICGSAPQGSLLDIKCMVSDSVLCRVENFLPSLKLFFFRN